MEIKPVQMNYKVDEDIKARVVAEAKKLDRRTPGWYLNNLLRTHYKKLDKAAPKEKPAFTSAMVIDVWTAPPGLNLDSWREFEQHRKDMKKPLTDAARTKAANRICGLTDHEQQATIDKSIESSWAGLFPEKAKYNKSFIERQNDSTFEQLFGKDESAIEGECDVRE